MTDLDKALAEARERLYSRFPPAWTNGFDAAAAIAREVFVRLKARIQSQTGNLAEAEMKMDRLEAANEYGFEWGNVTVQRVAELDKRVIVRIFTEHDSITIYASAKGRRLRAFRDNSKELT